MAITVWAFATAGVAAPTFFDAIALDSQGRIREFNPQDMANILWAYATAGVAALALFEAIAAETQGRIREFNTQNMSNTIWAFATAGVSALTLFEVIAAEAQGRTREFNSQQMANTVWAFATAGVSALTLFEAIAAEALVRLRDFNSQNIVNIVWAFACVAWAQHHVFLELGSAIAERVGELEDIAKSQLYPVISVEAFGTIQRDVSTMLEWMSWGHRFEYVTEEGFSLDLAQPDSKVAIEVGGPSHYLIEATTRSLNGG
ncbi:MAG: DUF1601 domain-containing protein, partial [Planctomycetota bacterium]